MLWEVLSRPLELPSQLLFIFSRPLGFSRYFFFETGAKALAHLINGRASRRSPNILIKIGRMGAVGCNIFVRWIKTWLSDLTKTL
jgi:hypothetical protein